MAAPLENPLPLIPLTLIPLTMSFALLPCLTFPCRSFLIFFLVAALPRCEIRG